MKELTPIKVSADLLDEEAVARHVCILGVPIARRLLDHQVRVVVAQYPADANLLGQLEIVY
jgi:hypothetical protein